MTLIIVALLFSVAMCALAFRANTRFRCEKRLPMQWWFTGEVTWRAPRPVALAFIPALAIVVFAIYVTLASVVEPRAGQEKEVLPAIIVLGATFLAAQGLHLWLIAKTLRRPVR